MYTVSTGYDEQNFRAIRNASHIKIAFGVVDPQGAILSNPTDNGHLDYSAVDRVDMGVGVSQTYQTLEHNRFILDGKNTLAEHTDFLFQGYVGNLISNAAGIWETPPTVTIEFDDYTKFSALTFNFDTTMDEYPTEMQITAYKDGVVVSDETVYPNKAEYWIYDTELPTLNKLVVIMKKSLRPYRRARILSLLWGFTQELTEADISECTMQHTVEMLSANLPKFTFNFTMLDQSKRYDPESPDTLWDYLESLQPVNVQIGQDLDDGTIEWIPLCNLYTTGDVSVGAQGVVTEVTFQTKALLNHLDTKFTHGLWRPNNPISLYDLAQEVIAEVEYDKTVIFDDVLKTIYTSTPLPIETVATCLQLIANAGMCVLDTNRSGAISITPYQTDAQDFTLDFHSMTDPPSTSKVPPLRDVVTSYTSFVKDSEEARLAEAVIQDTADGDIITIKHQAATDQYVEESEVFKLTNLITNGSFENGMTDWAGPTSEADFSIVSDSYHGSKAVKMSFSGRTVGAYIALGRGNIYTVVGHKYYARCMCKVTEISGLSSRDVYGHAEVGLYGSNFATTWPSDDDFGWLCSKKLDSSHLNEWIRYSIIFNIPSGVDYLQFRPIEARNGCASFTGQTDSVILIDLTETFGAGNEPDKAWCDTHLNYFDGTIYISKDGYVANNMVKDPAFKQNFTDNYDVINYSSTNGTAYGWAQYPFFGDSHYKKQNFVYLIGSENVPEMYVESKFKLPVISNHKYYCSMMVLLNFENAKTVEIYFPYAPPYPNVLEVIYTFKWTKVSGITQHADNFMSKWCFDMNNGGEASIVWFTEMICIDLTETFGAGNEPSKEWCDANIPFFEGTSVITPNKVKEIRPYTYATELVMTQSLPGKSVSYMIKGHSLNQSTVGVAKRYNELG